MAEHDADRTDDATRASADTPGVVLCLTTCPADHAQPLVRALLDARLIACANISAPVRSLYRWHGAISDDAEVQIWMETARDRVESLAKRLVELHPYDVPKWLVFPATHALEAFARWCEESTREDAQR